MKNFTVKKKTKKSWDHKLGLLLGYALILLLFAGVFHISIVMSKSIFGIYDLEERIDRLEQIVMEKNNENP